MMPPAICRRLLRIPGRVCPKAEGSPRICRATTTFQGMARTAVEACFQSMIFTHDDQRVRLLSTRFKSSLDGYHVKAVFEQNAARDGTKDPLSPTWPARPKFANRR